MNWQSTDMPGTAGDGFYVYEQAWSSRVYLVVGGFTLDSRAIFQPHTILELSKNLGRGINLPVFRLREDNRRTLPYAWEMIQSGDGY